MKSKSNFEILESFKFISKGHGQIVARDQLPQSPKPDQFKSNQTDHVKFLKERHEKEDLSKQKKIWVYLKTFETTLWLVLDLKPVAVAISGESAPV